jgi:glycosyltransferase involved in cell wall biosynthesis
MNIAVDVLALLGPMSKNRGIGNYAKGQLRAMFAEDRDNRYFLLNFYEDVCLRDILEYGDNVSEHYFCTGQDLFLLRNTNYSDVLEAIVRNFIAEHEIDVFYITSPFDVEFSYIKSWFTGVRYAVTVYDIIPYVFHERYLPTASLKQWYEGALDLVVHADAQLVISRSVKDDLVRYAKADPSNIYVIYAGADEKFRVLDIPEAQRQNIRQKYGIREKFIMCTGGDDDRKNMTGLVEAYSRLPQVLRAEYQLVIVCKLSSVAVERYEGVKRKFDVQDNVIFTNFVSDEELVALYNMAHVSAFVSQYEGFGLPVLESMLCGLPVLTSNNSSLAEIGEGAALLADPFDASDIAKKLEELLTDTDLANLRRLGFERAEHFTWERTASIAVTALNDIVPYQCNVNETTKKRLACFTPLPPLQSGISDYGFDILCELASGYDIDVFTDTGYTPDCCLPECVRVFPHTSFQKKKMEYDALLFQVGNSLYHAYMFPYIKSYGGTVVLHDCNLHGVMSAMTIFKDGDEKAYLSFLEYDYDAQTTEAILKEIYLGKQDTVFNYPVNGFVTQNADKIIAHSLYAKKELLCRDIGLDVTCVASYAKVSPEDPIEAKSSAREKLGIPKDQTVIASFGHIHKTKRSVPVLKALNRLIRAGNGNIGAYYVGALDATIKDVFETVVAENAMKDSVVVTGYTELDEFLLYMDAADICLNLRYPYNGETSGSLMRILAKGKCVIVNDLGSFSEIPDKCCVKLPSSQLLTEDNEIDAIYSALSNLLKNPEQCAKIGENARKYAEEYLDIKKIAKQYREILDRPSHKPLSARCLMRIKEEFRQHFPNEKETVALARTLAYAKHTQ